MFGLVKKLFGKASAKDAKAAKPAAPQGLSTLYPTLPPKPAPKPVAAPTASASTAAAAQATPVPVAKTAAPASEPPAAPRKSAPIFPEVFSKETIDLPFKHLWSRLNPQIVQSLGAQPKGELKLPLNLVQAHLATGGMKIPFSQFRQFSPDGFANAQIGDTTEITLPISEILSRLKPEQLARRTDQKRIVVPDDIEPIFGPKGTKKGNLRIANEKKNPPPAPTPLHAPEQEPVAAPVAIAPLSVPDAAPIVPVTPIAPEPVAEAPAPIVQAAPPEPEPISNIPLRAPNLDPSLATLKPTPPVPSRTVPSKTPPEQTFTVALMDVAGFWAEKGRIELEKLYKHSLEIPFPALEAALKRGKVEFPWREVRPWVRLASGNSLPTLDDDVKVELPLAWIAPRFLEHQHKAAPKKRFEIGDDIPDVFVRNAPAEPATVPFPGPAAAVPAAALEASTEPREFGEIFGQPDKKEWSLGEVSQRATSLPGVAGAIIATSDGLLVGGKWPGADGDTVAAFVPQMYSRMTSYTKELQLGEPDRFTLLIDNNVPLQIFKSADSYFTVLGRAGENLPTKELNAIATRLAASITVN